MRSAVGQGRPRQPDPLVQGPGRRGRAGRLARDGLQGAGLPVDRQPGQRGGRGGGPGRASARAVLVPVQPRAAEDPHHGGLRRHVRHRRRQLRRREPAGLRARRRARGLGVRQRQRPALLRRGLQDPRLRDRRAARLAAARPDRGADRLRRPAHQDRQGVPRADRAGPGRGQPYKVFGAQATGCSPVAAAFTAGHDVVRPVKPDTIAKSLAIGNPADGPYVLDVVRRTGGAVEDVTDAEIVEGIRLLARTEGIFGETAGGVTVGVLRKLLASGQLDPAAETVIINSGDGLKTLDAVAPVARPSANSPAVAAFDALECPFRAAKACDMSRLGAHPDHPADLHRGRGRGEGRPARCVRSSPSWTPATRASRPGSWTTTGRSAGSSTSTWGRKTCGSPRVWTPRSRRAPRFRSFRPWRAAERAGPAAADRVPSAVSRGLMPANHRRSAGRPGSCVRR